MKDTAFPPVVGRSPKVLVLGSMPGIASLAAREYYAHPRNAFWPVMAALGMPVLDVQGNRLPYAQRLRALEDHRVALWDVVHRCERPGSLDSAIVHDSVEPNDFTGFFHRYCSVQVLVFNGASVEGLFRRHALPLIDPALLPPQQCCLPSTSPANARLSLREKIAAWSVLRPWLA